MLPLELFAYEAALVCLSCLLVALIDRSVAVWSVAKELVSDRIIVLRAVNEINCSFDAAMLDRDHGVLGHEYVDSHIIHKLVLHEAVLEHDFLVQFVHILIAFVLENDAPGSRIWHDLVFEELGEADPGSLVGSIGVGVHILAVFVDQQWRDCNLMVSARVDHAVCKASEVVHAQSRLFL